MLQHCVCCFNTAPHYRGAAPGAQIGGCGGTPCGTRAVGALVASARVPGCVSSPPWRVFCGALLAVRAYRVHRAQLAVAFRHRAPTPHSACALSPIMAWFPSEQEALAFSGVNKIFEWVGVESVVYEAVEKRTGSYKNLIRNLAILPLNTMHAALGATTIPDPDGPSGERHVR